MKVGLDICKPCRLKAHGPNAWNDFAQQWGHIGSAITDNKPYVHCPYPHIREFHAKILKQINEFVKTRTQEENNVTLSFARQDILLLGENVPEWCPRYWGV